jgi:hypothetical protein
VEAVWPGWCFYASLQMNPRNPIWREVASINAYVTRCQSIFQTWEPDNDLAILWDYKAHPGKMARMSVHERDFFYNAPIGKVASILYDQGYCFDYISPRQIKAGLGRRYRAVIDPRKGDDGKRAGRPAPFNRRNGLPCTRWKKDGRCLYFVVNTNPRAMEISAPSPFTVMDALSGEIKTATIARLEAGHSLFVSDVEEFKISPGGDDSENWRTLNSVWSVEPVCGGPRMPEKRILEKPDGWEKFDDSFSGTMAYKTVFKGMASSIELGRVCEIARVRLNGRDLGVRFMAPYRFKVPENLCRTGENELVVEVTNLGANRIRYNDRNKINWKYFHNINIVGMNYHPLDASNWNVRPSGLFGPVRITIPSNLKK